MLTTSDPLGDKIMGVALGSKNNTRSQSQLCTSWSSSSMGRKRNKWFPEFPSHGMCQRVVRSCLPTAWEICLWGNLILNTKHFHWNSYSENACIYKLFIQHMNINLLRSSNSQGTMLLRLKDTAVIKNKYIFF